MPKFRLAHILWAVAFGLVFLLLPESVTTPSQYGNTVFAVGLGLDVGQNPQNISLSAQIIAAKPNAASSESYQIVSADGTDVVDAMENLRRQMGKLLGLSHCYVVVVSDDICNKYNLAILLDPLVRTERLGTNTILAHTTQKAKDLLVSCEEIGGDAQNVLESLTKYNYEYVLNKDASLYDFYKDYLSTHTTGLVVTIDSQKQDSTSSGGGSQQNSEQSSAQTNILSAHKIINDGKAVAFYNGQKVANVNSEILRGLGWLEHSSKFNVVKLKNINTEKLHNATVTLKQKDCNVSFKASINNNVPTLYATINTKAKIVGIENTKETTISDLSAYFDKSFNTTLQELVTKECDKASEFQRENNIDILNYYKIFNSQIHNEWQNYLSTLDNPKEYASKIQVFVKTNLKQAN